jgi:predicted nucleic acid-binding protein
VITYFDTSSLLKLVIDEVGSEQAGLIWDTAGEALRGYDAVHLAAALFMEARILTSADTDMCAAASRRGLHVANPIAL